MRKFIRTLGVLLASMAILWAPAVALADTNGAQIADQDPELRGMAIHYHPVSHGDDHEGYAHRSFWARPELFTVAMPEADPYLAYCIEITMGVRRNLPTEITPWDGFLGQNAFHYDPKVREKIAWIVHYSYPSRSLQDFAHDVKVPGLTIAQAVTGTQSAIWRLTDGIEPDFAEFAAGTGNGEDAQAIEAVYNYLLSEHNTGLKQKELMAHIALTVPDVPGFAGELYGPIVIDSDQEFVSLQTRDDITLVDSQGKHLSREKLPRNTDVYLDLSDKKAAGEVELTASVEDTAFHGWLISTVLPKGKHGQTLVMVRKFSQRSADKVKISWRGADEICRDENGVPMRDSQTGQIIAQDSSLCVLPAPPKPPELQVPPEPEQPVLSEPEPEQPVQANDVSLQQKPELAKTGSAVVVLSLLAMVMTLTGGFLVLHRKG